MSTKLEWKPQHMPDGHVIPSSLTPDEIEALRRYAENVDVLEIGSAYGYSTINMAERARHVTAIDPHAGELLGSYETLTANLARYGLGDKVTIVRDFSQNALPALIERRRRFGLVFVDGNHDVQVQDDVSGAVLLAAGGGRVAVHDYDQYDFPEIKRVCDLAAPYQTEVVDTLWVGRVP
jgi:predicted O-methyltransferase YrrM